ncbi:MAG: NAD(P)H-binding protein [Propionibacteriaceae bacterium]|nr:NAD(P)H-binding protein [Propionibacteriaceae bacterium]
MRIAIIGATGKAGRLIAQEAAARGHDVVRFARSAKDGVDVVKDVFDLDAADLHGLDVVVDALGFFTPDTLPNHTRSLEHLAGLLVGSNTRLVVVGGAGSLYMDPQKTTQLFETPTFPDEFKPLAEAQAQQLAALREHHDVKWTYVSPAADFQPDAPRTGRYVLGGELFETDSNGLSELSYADYAIAFVDEVERAEHVGERISVRNP